MKITHTLAFMVEGDRVLLGQHERGLAKGKWNGFGGKVEAGESVEAAFIREVQEEVGLTPTEFSEVAEMHFDMPVDGVRMAWVARVFMVTKWTGEVRASEEMVPQWFAKTKMPFELMWDDDKLWQPQVLAGERVLARFKFDAAGKVVDYEINNWEASNG